MPRNKMQHSSHPHEHQHALAPDDQGHRGQSGRPPYNPAHVQPQEVSASREESRHRDSLCRLCSDQEHQVNHHHISSQGNRDFAVMNRSRYLFNCMMCKQDESTVRPSTRKIILTSSTLYNVWTIDKLNLPIHIEIESIVGGRVRDLTRALIMLYLKYPERLEIILIAGLNNVGEGQSPEEIIDEIWELKQAVQAHSQLHSHTEPGIVSVSTLLYAPKFCSLDVPASCPEWQPPHNFSNRRHDMECVNVAIAAMNKGAQVNYLNLHYEGIRINKKSNKTMHRHNPSSPIWREREIRKRLHLTPQYKTKIVRNAAKLFVGGLKNHGGWAKS
eukprot:GFUD01020908.1.p1 GENE.GFUD01020908.1~~GFUD01020908.1.p1  ORF type:complete len:330 (+),score=86.68 GFUD01020908.1:460-1449(+)